MKVATLFHKTWVKAQDQNKCEQVCGSLMYLLYFKWNLLHFVSKEEFVWQRAKPFCSQWVQKEMDGETETLEKEAFTPYQDEYYY